MDNREKKDPLVPACLALTALAIAIFAAFAYHLVHPEWNPFSFWG